VAAAKAPAVKAAPVAQKAAAAAQEPTFKAEKPAPPVSEDDAKKVWEKAADGNKVTNAEKWTLRYCFSTFNWTRAGHDYVQGQLTQLQKDGTVTPA